MLYRAIGFCPSPLSPGSGLVADEYNCRRQHSSTQIMSRPMQLEEQSVIVPNDCDILCGKNKNFSKHPGNRLFKDVIASYADCYNETSSKQQRMAITKEIVRTVKSNYNARFLKPMGDGKWEEIGDNISRDKVSHALRFAATKEERKAARRRQRRSSSSRSVTSCSSEEACVSSVDSSARNPYRSRSARDDDLLDIEKTFRYREVVLSSSSSPTTPPPRNVQYIASQDQGQSQEEYVSSPSSDVSPAAATAASSSNLGVNQQEQQRRSSEHHRQQEGEEEHQDGLDSLLREPLLEFD